MRTNSKILASTAPKSVISIRLIVGWVFLSEGIQKFLFPAALGVGRFAKIGIPNPQFMAPFVGVVEIIFGALLIFGLLTRIATILFLCDFGRHLDHEGSDAGEAGILDNGS